ncbi:MAG TPA: cellulase N-terminal Ig-like domain-containing protein, partial [Niabella sp.]|nr:cellulase N-terminal Ig-like domain-containing protein [Niabella sp.]
MMRLIIHLLILHLPLFGFSQQSWIRINQIGYLPDRVKVAVWGGKDTEIPKQFYLVDSVSGKIVYRNKMGKNFGAYGTFKNTFR